MGGMWIRGKCKVNGERVFIDKMRRMKREVVNAFAMYKKNGQTDRVGHRESQVIERRAEEIQQQ